MSFTAFTRRSTIASLHLVKHLRYFSTNNGKIKTSYYHERGTFSFVQSTLGDLVDEAANDHGDEIGFNFQFQNIQRTFHQFKEETDQLACGLISLGLEMGNRIAIYGPNSYQWILTQYAALKAGLTVVNINPASTEKELEYTLKKVGCRGIIAPEYFKSSDYYKTLSSLMPEMSNSLPGQINSQRLKQLQNVIIISDKTFPGTYRLQDVMQAAGSIARQQLNNRRKKVQFDRPAIVMFTSGTTGKPKAATLSHFQIINQSKSFIKRAEFDKEKPVICFQVPLFHAFGSIVGLPTSLQSRGKCVFPSEHFDPVASFKAIEEEKCTVVYGVPTMFNVMVEHLRYKQYNLHSWKKVQIGASPVPLELIKFLQDKLGLAVMNGYGATETSTILSVHSPLDCRKVPESTGRPIEFVEVKIIDKHGDIVPINTNGEVLSRSPFVFSGYWDEPKKTAEVIDSKRWYHTGDIGRMDEEGYIYITGRIKDMVIRGGENIYPTEIENFLLTHPAISEAYVVGVPDQKFGEELCGSVRLRKGCAATEDEIREFCKGKISYFKIPRYILFCEDYPKTESGKIMKHKLRDECIKRLNL